MMVNLEGEDGEEDDDDDDDDLCAHLINPSRHGLEWEERARVPAVECQSVPVPASAGASGASEWDRIALDRPGLGGWRG